MIIEIPDHKDFESEGLEYAVMAYSNVLDLVLMLEEYTTNADDDSTAEDFWSGARGKLKNSASLLHQGLDFLLKAKICEISPFLLIDSNPEKYPKLNQSGNVSFSDFFTQDSARLPKIYNTACFPPLSPRFLELYEKSRTRRNKIMHTVDGNLVIEAKSVIKESLELVQYLMSKRWVEIRKNHLEESPESKLYFEPGVISERLLSEFRVLKDTLSNAEFEKTYGVPKRTRFYLCPDCNHADFVPEPEATCYLKPNTPESTIAHCTICNQDFTVTREPCTSDDCPSNVVIDDLGSCGICGE